jgi:hypothetical protein
MSNSSKAWSQGTKDANSGKSASNLSNKSWQVRQSYVAAFKSATKANSGKSGK